jgi:hypothetical protein
MELVWELAKGYGAFVGAIPFVMEGMIPLKFGAFVLVAMHKLPTGS